MYALKNARLLPDTSSYMVYIYALAIEGNVTQYVTSLHDSTAILGLGIIFYFSRSHSNTPRSGGFPRTSDRPLAETSTPKHDVQTRQSSMLPAGFKHTIRASKRPQTHTLDRAGTGIGHYVTLLVINDLRAVK